MLSFMGGGNRPSWDTAALVPRCFVQAVFPQERASKITTVHTVVRT